MDHICALRTNSDGRHCKPMVGLYGRIQPCNPRICDSNTWIWSRERRSILRAISFLSLQRRLVLSKRPSSRMMTSKNGIGSVRPLISVLPIRIMPNPSIWPLIGVIHPMPIASIISISRMTAYMGCTPPGGKRGTTPKRLPISRESRFFRRIRESVCLPGITWERSSCRAVCRSSVCRTGKREDFPRMLSSWFPRMDGKSS